jgi:hypothetical protein
MRKRGRAVEGTGLENRQRETVRGFESHRFRHLAGISANRTLCKASIPPRSNATR